MLYFVTRRILEIKFWWKKKLNSSLFFHRSEMSKKLRKSHFKTYLSFKKLCPHFLWPNWQLNSSVVRGLQVPNSSSRIQFIKSRHRSLTNLHTRVSTYTCHYLPRYIMIKYLIFVFLFKGSGSVYPLQDVSNHSYEVESEYSGKNFYVFFKCC